MAELIKGSKDCDYLGGEEMPLQKTYEVTDIREEKQETYFTLKKNKKSYLINVRIPGAGEMIVEVG